MGEQEEINIEQEGIKMELYSETLLQNSSILLYVVLEKGHLILSQSVNYF